MNKSGFCNMILNTIKNLIFCDFIFYFLLLFLIVIINVPVFTEDNTYPGAFIFFNPSAEAVSMGGVYSVIIPDPSGIFNNPANIGEVSKSTLQSSYFIMPFDTGFYYLSFTYPWQEKRKSKKKLSGLTFSPDKRKNKFKLRQAISVGYSAMVVRDIEKRDIYGNLTGISQDDESMFGISYARNFYYNDLFFGLDLKYYYSSLVYAKSSAYIFDIGLNYKPNNKYILGLVIKNILGEISWTFNDIYTSLAMEKKEPVPFGIVLGTGYTINEKILLAIDLEYANKNMKYYFGSSYKISKKLELCMGYNKTALSFGFSLGNYKSKSLLPKISYATKLGLYGNNIYHLFTASIFFN